jgi:hypothetical protein
MFFSFQEVEKANAAGYECSSIDVNPDQPEESLQQIREMLQKKHCDLFIVGFGLRSNPVCGLSASSQSLGLRTDDSARLSHHCLNKLSTHALRCRPRPSLASRLHRTKCSIQSQEYSHSLSTQVLTESKTSDMA